MSDDIAVRSSGAVPFATTNSAAATKSSAASGGSVAAGTTASTGGAAGASTTYANPSVQIDGRLGLVVIAFHDQAGHVIDSIPTQKQLQAYRDGSASLPKASGDPAAVAATSQGH